MNKIIVTVFFIVLAGTAFSQQAGTLVSKIIESKSLQNTGGENPNRKITVYLPPGYEKSSKRYPVIYYLHGFMGTDSISPNMKSILDMGVNKQKIRPYILVISDQYTL